MRRDREPLSRVCSRSMATSSSIGVLRRPPRQCDRDSQSDVRHLDVQHSRDGARRHGLRRLRVVFARTRALGPLLRGSRRERHLAALEAVRKAMDAEAFEQYVADGRRSAATSSSSSPEPRWPASPHPRWRKPDGAVRRPAPARARALPGDGPLHGCHAPQPPEPAEREAARRQDPGRGRRAGRAHALHDRGSRRRATGCTRSCSPFAHGGQRRRLSGLHLRARGRQRRLRGARCPRSTTTSPRSIPRKPASMRSKPVSSCIGRTRSTARRRSRRCSAASSCRTRTSTCATTSRSPTLDAATCRLDVGGLVDRPLSSACAISHNMRSRDAGRHPRVRRQRPHAVRPAGRGREVGPRRRQHGGVDRRAAGEVLDRAGVEARGDARCCSAAPTAGRVDGRADADPLRAQPAARSTRGTARRCSPTR